MSKQSASLVHLGATLMILFCVIAITYFRWYPPPFFFTDGGWQGLLLLVPVVLILGPVLTLVVFKPGKRNLKFDLYVIGFLQSTVLTWGVWDLYMARPVAAVFTGTYFNTLSARELSQLDLTQLQQSLFEAQGPIWIYSRFPDDFNAMQQLRLDSFRTKRPLYLYSEYYVALDRVKRETLFSMEFDFSRWLATDIKTKQNYETFLHENQSRLNEFAFFSWHARHRNMIIALQRDDLSYRMLLDILPQIE